MLGKTKIKYIQSLGQKKHRDAEGLFIAEGPKIVNEILRSPDSGVTGIYALPGWVREHAQALPAGVLTEIDEIELSKISQLQTPNQVLAVLKQQAVAAPATSGRLILALDTIQDPGNLGTIIRIADWFGVSQLVCSNNCVDLYNPKVVQSTMGSILRVSVFYTDLQAWLQEQEQLRVYAAMLDGTDVTAMPKLQEGVILIGNESKGISPELLGRVNVRITIPQKGMAESLNAAVAAGIIVSHLV